jgi:hypothetical protein
MPHLALDAPWTRWPLTSVLLLCAVVSLRAIGNPDLGVPDADRILMDGVFLRDFLADLPALAMVLLTAWAFQRYREGQADGWLLTTAALLGLAAWTKQTAVFAGLWIVLERDISVRALGRPPLAGQHLLIYRYTDNKPPTAASLTLELPVVGKTLEVPRGGGAAAKAGTGTGADP